MATSGPVPMMGVQGLVIPGNPELGLGWYTRGAGFAVPFLFDGAAEVAVRLLELLNSVSSMRGWQLGDPPIGHGSGLPPTFGRVDDAPSFGGVVRRSLQVYQPTVGMGWYTRGAGFADAILLPDMDSCLQVAAMLRQIDGQDWMPGDPPPGHTN